MLRFATLPLQSGGHATTLHAVLDGLPENKLLWRILHFVGVGEAPAGLTMPAFEQAIRASADGYRMTWTELRTFAIKVEQVWDCLIVGSSVHVSIQRDTIEAAGYPGCDYVIDIFDSTELRVGAMSESDLARIRDVALGEAAAISRR
jgi:hypothetical protein